MSLDGFIAGPNASWEQPLGDGGEQLFAWYFSGDTDYEVPGSDMVLKTSPVSAGLIRAFHGTIGALVMGRRTFDIMNGWGGRAPLDVPVFIVTHTAPQEWVSEGSPFTFVTDGVESAVEQAKAVAGNKDVSVGNASIVQQCLKAGLLDEIHIDLVPLLLGDGTRLFEHFDNELPELECVRSVDALGVTHLTYRVVSQARSG